MNKAKAGGWLIAAGIVAAVLGAILWGAAETNKGLFEESADHTMSWVAFGLAGFGLLLGVILVSGSRES